jgi:hypothetical protein
MRIKSINFINGGFVKKKHSTIPKNMIKVSKKDSVLVRVMPGEIVIPLKHTKKIKQFLKKKNIKLPGL